MKKLFLSLLAVSTLILNSCSSDDDGNSSNVSLVGTWKLTAWNSTTAFDINNDGTASTNLLQEFDCYDNETIVFSANNTAIANSTSYADITAEITAGTTDEYTYTIECIDEADFFPLTWTLNGNTLIFDQDTEDEITATLSGNTISILIPAGFEVYSEDFSDVVVSEDIIFVYTKQ